MIKIYGCRSRAYYSMIASHQLPSYPSIVHLTAWSKRNFRATLRARHIFFTSSKFSCSSTVVIFHTLLKRLKDLKMYVPCAIFWWTDEKRSRVEKSKSFQAHDSVVSERMKKRDRAEKEMIKDRVGWPHLSRVQIPSEDEFNLQRYSVPSFTQ